MRAVDEVARRTYDGIENMLGLNLQRAVARYLMQPGSLIMERKMPPGIKAHTERLAAVSPGGTFS